MNTLEFIRSFRVLDYAIFDFAISFIGIYFIAPVLTKLFRKINLYIPRISWMYFTIPIGIFAHILVGSITPMTRDFISLQSGYPVKAVVVILLILGLRKVKILNKK